MSPVCSKHPSCHVMQCFPNESWLPPTQIEFLLSQPLAAAVEKTWGKLCRILWDETTISPTSFKEFHQKCIMHNTRLSHPSLLDLSFHLHLYTSLRRVPSTKHEGTGCFYGIISQLDSHTLWPKTTVRPWFSLSWFWSPSKFGDTWHPTMSPKQPWIMVISWFLCHCYCHCIKSPWQSLQWLLSRCPPPPLGVSSGQRATPFRCNRYISRVHLNKHQHTL